MMAVRLTKAEARTVHAGMDTLPGLLKTPEQWGNEFRASWGRTVEAIITHGKLLNEGKNALRHGEWLAALTHAGIREREAQRYMRVATRLGNATNLSVLPTAIASLDLLASLQPEAIGELIESGVVNPMVTTKELKAAVAGVNPPTESKGWNLSEEWIHEVVTGFFDGIDTSAVHLEHLTTEWTGKTFVKPPQIGEPHLTMNWVTKALSEWRSGRVTEAVLLLPVVSDVNWFHNILREFPVCFSLGTPGGKPGRRSPVALAYMGNRRDEFAEAFDHFGTTVFHVRKVSE
jgi:hypothetical protein